MGLAALTATALAAAPARATGDPELSWYTIETPHFRIHFPTGLEPIAKRVAQVAETAHDRLKGPLGYEPSVQTELIINDTSESANGSATALPYNQIALYVTSPDDFSPLGDYDDWYLSLVTHEYTHILHVDNITGAAAVINAILGKTYSPNQAQPRWIIEGLATLSETQHTSGGRLRSSIWDMYMRADVLDDNIARIDQFTGSPMRWPQASLWYLYGSYFLRWIADTYGDNVLKAVSQDYGGTTVPWGINRAIRRQTGRTYVELYEGFKDYLKRRYKEQLRLVEKRGLREGTPITTHGAYAYYPRFVPASLRKGGKQEIVYYRDDTDDREGLYKIPLDLPPGSPPGAERPAELIARTSGGSVAAMTDKGDLYFPSTAVWKNYYDRDDLFHLPAGARAPTGDEPEKKRLTFGQRTPYVDVNKDGTQLVFTVNARGTTFLEIADVASDGSLRNKRDLVPSRRFEQVYTPRFSPDGKLVAYSHWREGGLRDIRIAEIATGKVMAVTDDRAADMQPVFSADQKTLYFVSDRTGIPNVYAFDLATTQLKQVTNTRTGALAPAFSDDGKTMVYMCYSSRGYDLCSMPVDPARFLDAPAPPSDRPAPLPALTPVPIQVKPYNPLPTLRPHNYFLDFGPGQYSDATFTLTADGSDIAGIHSAAVKIVADVGAPTPDFSLAYNYNRLPVNLGFRFFHTVTPRNNYRINDERIDFNERATGFTTGLSLPIYDEHARHSLGLSYSVVAYTAELPTVKNPDPYAGITIKPREGAVNIVHLGYSFSNVEGGAHSPGPARGLSFSLDLDYGGKETASNFSTYAFEARVQGYIPIPWPWRPMKHHVLALRAGGGVSGGEYPSGNTYHVGGYDLERNALPDTILSGVLNGAFVLRGYAPNTFGGKEYLLGNAEYRFPIAVPDVGLSTLPFYLRRIDGNLFMDTGGAFDDFNVETMSFFTRNRFLDTARLHASIGAELWLGVSIGYGLPAQLRLGWAKGLTPDALLNGQFYFIASSAY